MLLYDYPSLSFKADTELICHHLLHLRTLDIDRSIQSFQHLFMQGAGYSESAILVTLNQIVNSEWAETEFTNFLNRCCYILINHWWSKPGFERATVDLVNLFEHLPPVVSSPVINTQKLRELVQQFTQTPQYQTLQHYAQIADHDFQNPSSAQDHSPEHDTSSEPMDNLIYRYPFLYPYFLLSSNSGELGQRAVKRKQIEMEHQFEDCLWNYAPTLLQKTSLTNSGSNPTLLGKEGVKTAIAHFAGQPNQDGTYQELSRRFLLTAGQTRSFKALKQQMLTYLTESIQHSNQPKYGSHTFNDWLEEQLKQILPESDDVKPSGRLLIQLCDQLITTLIADPSQVYKHSKFLDLQGNLGATFTVGFLLKIILVCSSVRSNLKYIKEQMAQRFASLLRHYETAFRKDVQWLTDCLDNWMIAQTIHFGRYGVARWSQLLQETP